MLVRLEVKFYYFEFRCKYLTITPLTIQYVFDNFLLMYLLYTANYDDSDNGSGFLIIKQTLIMKRITIFPGNFQE